MNQCNHDYLQFRIAIFIVNCRYSEGGLIWMDWQCTADQRKWTESDCSRTDWLTWLTDRQAFSVHSNSSFRARVLLQHSSFFVISRKSANLHAEDSYAPVLTSCFRIEWGDFRVNMRGKFDVIRSRDCRTDRRRVTRNQKTSRLAGSHYRHQLAPLSVQFLIRAWKTAEYTLILDWNFLYLYVWIKWTLCKYYINKNDREMYENVDKMIENQWQ